MALYVYMTLYVYISVYISTYIHIHTYMFIYLSFSPLHVSFSRAMVWLQLVGSFKTWVSFPEYSLFYRSLLQKRPIILRSLLVVATPQLSRVCFSCNCDMERRHEDGFKCIYIFMYIYISVRIYRASNLESVSLAIAMGWLRLVGSSKLQVSFAEYSLFYRALLLKRRIILRGLLIVTTPQPSKETQDCQLSFTRCLFHSTSLSRERNSRLRPLSRERDMKRTHEDGFPPLHVLFLAQENRDCQLSFTSRLFLEKETRD